MLDLRNLRYLGFSLLLPLVIGMPVGEDDTTQMSMKVAGGVGSYAYITRGCEGQVLTKEDIPFQDIGFSFDYKVKSPVQVGIRAGKIWEKYKYAVYTDGIEFKEMTNSYLNPHISLEGKWLGLGAGPFFAKKYLPRRGDRQWDKCLPSWHLRIGNPKFYFSIHMLENVPIYSGGGYIDLGLGGTPSRKVGYWLGLGTEGPYDNVGFVAKTVFQIKGSWYLDLAGRLGSSQGISESAVSVGLNYRL
jgi:hypothetical protein